MANDCVVSSWCKNACPTSQNSGHKLCHPLTIATGRENASWCPRIRLALALTPCRHQPKQSREVFQHLGSVGMSCFLVAACAIGITLLDFDVKRQTIIVQIMSMPSAITRTVEWGKRWPSSLNRRVSFGVNVHGYGSNKRGILISSIK